MTDKETKTAPYSRDSRGVYSDERIRWRSFYEQALQSGNMREDEQGFYWYEPTTGIEPPRKYIYRKNNSATEYKIIRESPSSAGNGSEQGSTSTFEWVISLEDDGYSFDHFKKTNPNLKILKAWRDGNYPGTIRIKVQLVRPLDSRTIYSHNIIG